MIYSYVHCNKLICSYDVDIGGASLGLGGGLKPPQIKVSLAKINDMFYLPLY